MSYTNKPFEELNVIDDFLMTAVASDEEVGVPFCRAILSVLLQRRIGKIRVISQRTIPALTPHMRGVRLDVEVEEYEEVMDFDVPSVNVFDIEPNLRKRIDLPKHNRFYQAKQDSRRMKSGEKNFSALPNLYVITITDFDPFGYDYMMYTIKNRCMEIPQMPYVDGLEFMYFYTNGSKGGNKEIQDLLKYFQNSTQRNVTNEVIQEIHKYVERVRLQPEVKEEYMTLEDIIYYESEAVRNTTEVRSIQVFLEEYGDIPEELNEKLLEEHEASVMEAWLKLAAKVNSISEFMEQMNAVRENNLNQRRTGKNEKVR